MFTRLRRLAKLRNGRRANVVRLLPLLDEADVLEANLRWYENAGIATVAFDNASSDATPVICGAAMQAGLLTAFERSERRLEWPAVSSALIAMAEAQGADVILITGADEFLQVEDGTALGNAIAHDLAQGHDLFRVETMEFCLTDEDDPEQADPTVRMRRYSPYRNAAGDRGVRLASGVQWPQPHGLRASSPHATRSPRQYINRHYPLRSPAQALARAKAGRLRPFIAGTSAAALALLIEEEDDLVLPARGLPRYGEDDRWVRDTTVAELRLKASSQLIRRMSVERTELRRELGRQRRQLADLRGRYAQVLLERDRLAAAEVQPVEGLMAAPAGWYDEQYRLTLEKYDTHYSESGYLPAWEAIAERIHPRERLLEIGCGTGQLAELLFDNGIRNYCGFDFSPFAIERARARLPHANLQIDDLRTTTLLAEADYDVVLCTEVLEHLDDDVGVLRRIRPGARVLATVPNFNSASHLRFFADEAEVAERYAPAFESMEVTSIPLARTNVIFLIEGIVRQPGPATVGDPFAPS